MGKNTNEKFSIKELCEQYRARYESYEKLIDLGESKESVSQKRSELSKSFLKRIDAEYEGKKLNKIEQKIFDIAAISRKSGGYDTTDFSSAMGAIHLLAEGEKNVRTDFTITTRLSDKPEAAAEPERYKQGDYKARFDQLRAANPPQQRPNHGGLLSAARDFSEGAKDLNDRKQQQANAVPSAVRSLEKDARGVANEVTKTVKEVDSKASIYLQDKSDRATVKIYEEAKRNGKTDFTQDQVKEYQKAKAHVVQTDASATCNTYKGMVQGWLAGNKEQEKGVKEDKKENNSWNPLKW